MSEETKTFITDRKDSNTGDWVSIDLEFNIETQEWEVLATGEIGDKYFAKGKKIPPNA